MRHGETTANQQNIVQGHMNNLLSQLGHTQAKLASDRLIKEEFDAVYMSDLRRTRQTAMPFAKALKGRTPVVYTPLLREKGGGIHEGESITMVEKLMANSGIPKRQFRADRGESWEDVANRADYFMNSLIEYYLLSNNKADFEKLDKDTLDSFESLNPPKSYIPPADAKNSGRIPIPESDETTDDGEDGQEDEEVKLPPTTLAKKGRVASFGMVEEIKALEKKTKSAKDPKLRKFSSLNETNEGDPKKILLITHGGFIKELHCLIQIRKGKRPTSPYIKNTAIFKYKISEVEENTFKYDMVNENDTQHLKHGNTTSGSGKSKKKTKSH